MDQSEPQDIINTHQQCLAIFCQQSQRERQQKEAGENDIERVELRGQQAAARQEC